MPGDCNFVGLPSEVECMNSVGLISQNQVVATDLLQLESCRPLFTKNPPIPPQALHIITPLLPHQWENELSQHPDQRLVSYVVSGLTNGFHIGYQRKGCSRMSARMNMLSASQNPGPVQQYLSSEREAGRIAGPFKEQEVPEVHVSRFGVIPKSDKPGEWRMILDLSFPPLKSVNEGIDRQLCSLRYPTVDQAVAHILQVGQGAVLAKVDVAHAFRNIPVHPDDRHLLGMRWGNDIFIDMALPFGLRSSPKIFTAVADALEWVFRHRGVTWCTHYVDDFLTVGRPESGECRSNLQVMLETCGRLGVPLKADKLEGPSTTLTFLGIVLDTVQMEIRLPAEKLDTLKRLIKAWQDKRACRKRELLSLIGKLSHACKVVQAGRIFLRRMIDLSTKAKSLDHWIKLSAEVQADLAWWEAFLPSWNARSMMEVHRPLWTPTVTFASDASGSWGCGAVWQQARLQRQWGREWAGENIAAKELVPIAVACAIWGPAWHQQQVLVLCDNMAVVQVISARSSRDRTLMHLLRCIHFFCAANDFKLRAEHIPGHLNILADAISRNHLQVLFREVPLAQSQPSPIPEQLWTFVTSHQPEWRSPAWREWLQASSRTAWHQALSGLTRSDNQST